MNRRTTNLRGPRKRRHTTPKKSVRVVWALVVSLLAVLGFSRATPAAVGVVSALHAPSALVHTSSAQVPSPSTQEGRAAFVPFESPSVTSQESRSEPLPPAPHSGFRADLDAESPQDADDPSKGDPSNSDPSKGEDPSEGDDERQEERLDENPVALIALPEWLLGASARRVRMTTCQGRAPLAEARLPEPPPNLFA